MRRLRAAARIERHVVPALQPAGDVPVGLAVADVIDRSAAALTVAADHSFLPTAMSGASGCFMPTM